MIKLSKPKFWDKKKFSFFSILLLPLSLIVIFLVFLKRNFSEVNKFQIPIICVGNIYIGGTGKTPTSILIAKELENLGFKPVILCKYHQNHEDEYNLIQNNFSNLIINKNRKLGILDAEKKGFKTLILDDGLQDYNIHKDLSIACFNQNQKIGNGLIIPSGPLRENLKALKKIDVVLINGDKNIEFEKKILSINHKLEIYYSHYQPINLNEFSGYNLLALAGIANPENFFQLIEKNNLKISQKLIFPDHYKFCEEEIIEIVKNAERKNLKIIMTEKDFFKVHNFKIKDLSYLKVKLEIKNREKFFNRLRKLYD